MQSKHISVVVVAGHLLTKKHSVRQERLWVESAPKKGHFQIVCHTGKTMGAIERHISWNSVC